MTPDAASSPHSLASATGLLLGALLVSAGVGALIGWAAGAADIGLIIGGLVGILLGIVAVYVVYSRAERGGTGARQASPSRAPNDEDSW